MLAACPTIRTTSGLLRAWTENEYDTMRFLAGNQRESLRMMHPLDRKRRASAKRAGDEMEAAIAAYEALRRR